MSSSLAQKEADRKRIALVRRVGKNLPLMRTALCFESAQQKGKANPQPHGTEIALAPREKERKKIEKHHRTLTLVVSREGFFFRLLQSLTYEQLHLHAVSLEHSSASLSKGRFVW